jgi:hypothetical protein
MAKVTGPLFSLTASGKIAKSLVYMTWKGIADVRKYVIPANPNTALQIVQRSKFEDGVDAWHYTSWNTADLSAWNLLASVQEKVMSGFNTFIKKYVNCRVAGKIWRTISAMVVSDVTSTGFIITCAGSAAETYTCHYGVSKTSMYLETAVVNTAGVLVATLTGLVTDTNYYCQISSTLAGCAAVTGILKQKTA